MSQIKYVCAWTALGDYLTPLLRVQYTRAFYTFEKHLDNKNNHFQKWKEKMQSYTNENVRIRQKGKLFMRNYKETENDNSASPH